MRLFFAFDLPDALRRHLASTLPDPAPGCRPVPADRLHVTLRFVGHVDDPVRETLARGLPGLPFAAGSAAIRGVGTFPPRGRPRVLWAGLETDLATARLQQEIEALCAAAGLETDGRPWSPHVTLARFPAGRPDWLGGFLAANADLTSEPFPIDRAVLYDSVPDGRGVRYVPVAVGRAG